MKFNPVAVHVCFPQFPIFCFKVYSLHVAHLPQKIPTNCNWPHPKINV